MRKKLSTRISRNEFARGYDNVKAINVTPYIPRGGIRL